MNFIAAVLFYHGGEVAAFWLLCSLIDKHDLKSILQPGMPGLQSQGDAIEKLITEDLPDIDKHLAYVGLPMSLLTVDWVIGLFLNYIPLKLSGEYLDIVFKFGCWPIVQRTAVELLRCQQ